MKRITCYETTWHQNFETDRFYKELNGHFDIPVGFVSDEGSCVGKLIRYQWDAYKADALSVELTGKLTAIGVVFVKEDSWKLKCYFSRTYYE